MAGFWDPGAEYGRLPSADRVEDEWSKDGAEGQANKLTIFQDCYGMYLAKQGMLESDNDASSRRSVISDAADLAAKVRPFPLLLLGRSG